MIIADKIYKSYNDNIVLNNISFRVKRGETLAIIGLNGSGKTTLLKILAGMLEVDQGYIRVHDREHNYMIDKHKETVGFISYGKSNIAGSGTIREMYDLCKKMYHVADDHYNYVIQNAGKQIGILEFGEKNAGELSLGEKSRAEFIYTLLICPDLWIMDEPTIGVDYETRMKMYEIIAHFKNVRAEKLTIVIATHNMQEMEAISERVIVLNKGKIIFCGPLDKMQDRYRTLGVIRFELVQGGFSIQDMPIRKYSIDGNKVEIIYDKCYVSAGVILKQILETALLKNISVTDIDLDVMIKNVFG